MKRVLITGGKGFVGGRLSRRLSGEFDVFASSRKELTELEIINHGNITPVLHKDIISGSRFPDEIDTVIHLAALNEWDCVKYPSEAIRVNIDETRIILENAIASGVKNFIYFSTAHVYASPLQGIVNETIPPVPVHPYAITHKAAEDYVIAADIQKKIHGIVIRLSNSFGAPVVPTVNRWTLLANDLARQAIEKRKLTLLSNGCQYRDFVCLTDVEEVIYSFSKNAGFFDKTIYNLGAGKSMRVIDMANAIAETYTKLFGESIPIELPANAQPSNEPELHFSIDRLLEAKVDIRNNVQEELKTLLLFCHQNFKYLG